MSETQEATRRSIDRYRQIGIAIDAVYVNWTVVATYSAGWRITIGKGQLISVNFTSSVPIQSGSAYNIIVVSTRGSENAISWKA